MAYIKPEYAQHGKHVMVQERNINFTFVTIFSHTNFSNSINFFEFLRFFVQNPLLLQVSVPFDVTRTGVLRKKPKTFFSLIRQGMKRSFFRKLVAARVVRKRIHVFFLH